MKKLLLFFVPFALIFVSCNNSNSSKNDIFSTNGTDSSQLIVEEQDISVDSLMNYLKDIKNIKNEISFKDSLSVVIKDFSTSNKCTYGYYYDYNTNWRYATAEKGNKFIISHIVMNSKSKNPHFPQFDVYKIDTTEGKVHLIGSMRYQFSRFDGHAEQIGLYVDEKNCFKYTNSVKFTCFDEFTEEELNNDLICVAFFDKPYEQEAIYSDGSIAYYDYFNFTDGDNYSEREKNPTSFKDFIEHNTIVKVFNLK